MGYLIFPLLLGVVLAPAPKPSQQKLADFTRFSTAVGRQIAIVDNDGDVREGLLRSVSTSDLTVQFRSGERIFQRDVIASAERMRDGRIDGAIRGAIFGVVIGAFATQGARTNGEAASIFIGSVVTYAGIGYAIDASQSHREPLYRAPARPNVKVSLRF